MGSCVSLSQNNDIDIGGVPSAHVISLNGDLLEFPGLSTVSEILQNQESESSFLCNSDRLNFNEYISSLNPNYQLQAGQIYFILPQSKLHNKLSASDMAALAVKASLALQKDLAKSSSGRCSHKRKNRKTRISPVILDLQNQEHDYSENEYILQNKIGGCGGVSNQKNNVLGVSRTGSVKKMQRVSSRRAKLGVRSFRLKLSTIDEGTTLQCHN
ncbi:hypothetical protein Leryth_019174 [Lithospermum erythrorhizon]|nr:hypothetical protein Leryth_019174 [Lithospermum erythrorhizon]